MLSKFLGVCVGRQSSADQHSQKSCFHAAPACLSACLPACLSSPFLGLNIFNLPTTTPWKTNSHVFPFCASLPHRLTLLHHLGVRPF